MAYFDVIGRTRHAFLPPAQAEISGATVRLRTDAAMDAMAPVLEWGAFLGALSLLGLSVGLWVPTALAQEETFAPVKLAVTVAALGVAAHLAGIVRHGIRRTARIDRANGRVELWRDRAVLGPAPEIVLPFDMIDRFSVLPRPGGRGHLIAHVPAIGAPVRLGCDRQLRLEVLCEQLNDLLPRAPATGGKLPSRPVRGAGARRARR